MNSQDIYSQIMANQKAMDPYLSNQGIAPQYFKDQVNERFNYNMPAIQNAAGLEARAYSLPGELMENYDQEYGGATGLSSMNRMNSILKNIGTQFGTSNAAWNIVDQAKVRQEELANSMLQQYMAELGAHEDRNSMLTSLWSTLYGEEQAMERLKAQLAANRRTTPTSQWNNIPTIPGNKTTSTKTSTTPVPNSLSKAIVNREKTQQPADTGSSQLDRLINQYRGIPTPSQFAY